MNRKTYWTILLNSLFLILYGYGLYLIYTACQYGNIMKRLPIIIVIGCMGLLWMIGWSVVYHIINSSFALQFQ
ncbi:MAG: hypothetical protein LUF02_11085 [Erysipelotrichaceae bacterium]|nr:hypothetical protein [Erysipelotrichaceae bacterium]